MAVDESRFRQALGHFASGVTVVTTIHEDRPYGITVSSFCSLSLRPPLVLVCIDNTVRTHDAIAEAGHYAVNVLSSTQEHHSRRFATRNEDKFSGIAWQPGELGLPLLDGALMTIECRLHQALPGGDHTIFIGEVVDAQIHEGTPLLYYRSGYHAVK